MTKKWRFTILAIILFIFSCSLIYYFITKPKYLSVKEYIPFANGQTSDVIPEDYYNINPILEIGATADNCPVFKYPQKAFKYLKKNYKVGLNAVKKAHHLSSISHFNYNDYRMLNWTSFGNDQEFMEMSFVSEFLDIYNNSYHQCK